MMFSWGGSGEPQGYGNVQTCLWAGRSGQPLFVTSKSNGAH